MTTTETTTEVFGDARVFEDARVADRARVSGNAEVFGAAYVYGDAQVSGSAWVSGDAQVSGSADLRQLRHVLTVGPVGSKGRTVTIHRHYDGPESTHWGNLVVAGCWSGTLDALAARIAGEEHGWSADDAYRYRADYEAVIALARPRVAEWAAEPLTVEDHARWAVVSA